MMQEAIGQRLARALAKVAAAPWEKVQCLSHSRSCDCAIESEIVTHYDRKVDRQLFRLCPQPSGEGGGREGVFVLNTNAQEAVIALGIYLIESGYRHVDRWSLLFTLYVHVTNLVFLEYWITCFVYIEDSPAPHFLTNLPGIDLPGCTS